MKLFAVPLLLGAIGAAALPEAREGLAPEAEAQPAPRDCFNARTVNGFTPDGDRAIVVRVSRGRQYRLELGGYCPDVDGAPGLALRARGGSSFVCAGADADIFVRGPAGRQRCLVTAVRRLSPEEIEAARRR